MKGIDVSGWQPKNITEIVDYDFAIIKATEGTNFVSPHCDAQYQAAKKRGKKLGVYHFASGLDARAEAEFFVKNIEGYIGEAVLVLDWEANAVSRGREWVRTFVKRVKELTKVPPIIYGSASPLSAHDIPGIAAEENCGLWVAAYPHSNQSGYRDEAQMLGSVIRQYTSKGRLPGYNGDLDLNISVLSPESWDKYARGARDGSASAPQPAPAKKSNDEIATEVIGGAWGNGEDRKNRLTAAGYNPSDIQAIVNQRLGAAPAKKPDDVIANEVIGGLWGNGDERKNRLQAAGYDYNAIQGMVNAKVGTTASNPATEWFTVPSGPAGYLGNIAARFGVKVSDIVIWNQSKYPSISANYVQAGWVIRVK